MDVTGSNMQENIPSDYDYIDMTICVEVTCCTWASLALRTSTCDAHNQEFPATRNPNRPDFMVCFCLDLDEQDAYVNQTILKDVVA